MMSRVPKYLARMLFLVTAFSLIWFHTTSEACTGIMLRTANGDTVHGRTLEFGVPISTSIVVAPRNYEFTGKAPGGPGLKYRSRYSSVGIMTFDDLAIADGLNEKGLAVGAFYLPTFAKYTETDDANRSKALSPLDFPNWILSMFSTISEVRTAIERGDAIIAPTVLDGWGPDAPPLHYAVYDAKGGCLVVEPVDGKLRIYNNPIGTLTNSPTFDWHLINLRNYLALSPINVPQIEIDGLKLQQLGQGNGMLGLPGDYTPPSRFVRAAFFSAFAIPSANADVGVQQVFHILNNFDIPLGSSRQEDGKVFHSDFTQATTARDPKNLRYYYRTYEDQTIRMVDLKKFDLDAKEVKKLSTKGSQSIVDMSSQMK